MSRLKIPARLLIGFGVLMLMIAGLSGFTVPTGQSSRTIFSNLALQNTHELLADHYEKPSAAAVAQATDDLTRAVQIAIIVGTLSILLGAALSTIARNVEQAASGTSTISGASQAAREETQQPESLTEQTSFAANVEAA
jgi:hypothetical protein